MIQLMTKLACADNSGAKLLKCIGIVGAARGGHYRYGGTALPIIVNIACRNWIGGKGNGNGRTIPGPTSDAPPQDKKHGHGNRGGASLASLQINYHWCQ